MDFTDKIPIGKAEDLTGKTFGLLKVLYRVKGKNPRETTWRCQCQCENHTIVDVAAGNLKAKHTTSCGCYKQRKIQLEKREDLTGKHFGRLTVLQRGEDYVSLSGKSRRSRWLCQCECGNTILVEISSLKNGHTQSCGCLHKEACSQKLTKNLIGQRFGSLVVISRNGTNNQGNAIWHCKCDCGNECDVSGGHLQTGDTKSCGCLISSGANKIALILRENNIPFEQEKTFSTCIFPDTQKMARFDFWVNNSYIIEYDGQQHFYYTGSGWNTKENYEKNIEHDKIKNEWCKNNNIPIIRIPYYNIENITINDLILK